MTAAKPPLLSGLRGFIIVWIGQVVSLLGTAMSGFGLTIRVYELTGSATALSLMGFFFVTPMLVISPLAGALVDRSNRKLMMMISDLASGLATIAILTFYLTGRLDLWPLRTGVRPLEPSSPDGPSQGRQSSQQPQGRQYWENLCSYCHDDEHSREILGQYLSGR